MLSRGNLDNLVELCLFISAENSVLHTMEYSSGTQLLQLGEILAHHVFICVSFVPLANY